MTIAINWLGYNDSAMPGDNRGHTKTRQKQTLEK